MSETKTVFDVTQLVHWQGRLSGIPRVIHEMAIRYAKLDGVIFATWDKYANEYIEVDLEKSLRDRTKQIYYAGASRAIKTTQNKVVSKKTPVTVRTKDFGKKVVRKLGVEHHAMVVYRKLTGATAYGLPSHAKKISFQAGDTLIVLWGEMQYTHFADKLVELKQKGVRLVQMIHDMIPLVVPHLNGHSTKIMDDYCKKVLPAVDLVIVQSKSTSTDVKNWLKTQKIPIPKIATVRLGEDFVAKNVQRPNHPELKNVKPEKFVLCVGTVEARKNHTILYYAYKLAKSRGIDLPPLVIVGGRGWRTENILSFMSEDPDMGGKILLPKDVDDSALAWLYQNCLFTVYPSMYEGWGIPIAESIFNKKPCLASSSSSMSEIAPGLVEHFNPYSTDECLEGLVKLADAKMNRAVRRRLDTYKTTTWNDTFNQLNTAIKEI